MNFKNIILFKGKKLKFGKTQNITLQNIIDMLFPQTFDQKYRYLGAVPYKLPHPLEPLVVYMDYKAKPWWCPRWVLRFLHLFGNDNSVVRTRNKRLQDLYYKITKGYFIWDYKFKWQWYDLRISITGDSDCINLARGIETQYYQQGLREDLYDQIKSLDPYTTFNTGYTTNTLKKELLRLEAELEKNKPA